MLTKLFKLKVGNVYSGFIIAEGPHGSLYKSELDHAIYLGEDIKGYYNICKFLNPDHMLEEIPNEDYFDYEINLEETKVD